MEIPSVSPDPVEAISLPSISLSDPDDVSNPFSRNSATASLTMNNSYFNNEHTIVLKQFQRKEILPIRSW